MLARLDGFEHELPSNAIAANELDHDVHVRVLDHLAGITHDLDAGAHQLPSPLHIEVGHNADFNAAPGAANDLFLVALQDGENAGADRANAQQTNADGFQTLVAHDACYLGKLKKIATECRRLFN